MKAWPRVLLITLLITSLPAQQPPPAQTPPAPAAGGNIVLNLPNASLTEVIDILARRLKLNYILDPRVKGSVIINTYGEIRAVEIRSLLETILRINGATMVQVGDIFRIVPTGDAARLPLKPQTNLRPEDIPEDERMSLNMIFLKYVQVTDMAKLLDPFRGEGSAVSVYEPANLLMLLDNNRSMRRTMELIAMFDSDSFATQRVKLFDVKNGRPSDLAKELDAVFKSIAMNEKASSVRFLALDRISTLIAVAPNPGVFEQVEIWLKKLDIPIKSTAGSTDNYVYRVKYGRAETIAIAIMQLYGGLYYGMPYGGMGMGMGMGMGGMGYGGMGGMGMGGMGMGGYGMGGMGMGGMGMGGMNPMQYAMGGYPGGGMFGGQASYGASGVLPPSASSAVPLTAPAGTSASPTPGTDLTGAPLGAATGSASQMKIPRVVPNPFDNSLLVQGTPTEWDQISRLLEKLDVPPMQVLIEARIYEVNLDGVLSSGVEAFLQRRTPGRENNRGLLEAALGGGTSGGPPVLSLSFAGLGQTRELLTFITAQESNGKARTISAPSVIATDSIPAVVNVGTEVPTLSATSASGVQSGGNTVFANSIQNRNAGVTLQVMARVIPSGIVTLVINQEVSAALPPGDSGIQSPSFSKRNVNTQVTVQDGDTVAIAGIIQETGGSRSSGIPFLNRIPIAGAAFGNRSYNKARTELVVFLTPRVIYDTNQIMEASDELRTKLRKLNRYIKE